jgi:PAS domain S-box-containing protein
MARVLVVDDEEGIRRTTAIFLQAAGHDVRTAGSVQEARAHLAANGLDVVLSDILMPGEDGLALLAAVRETCPRVQVVLFTGEPTLETVTEALRRGAFDYLPKPVERDTLLSAVTRALRAKVVLDENARLTDENERYRDTLEGLVEARTAQLSESEQRFRLAAECASDVIYERRADTGIAVFHGPVDERLGYPPGGYPRDLKGWRDSVHPDDWSQVAERLRQPLREGGRYSHDYRLRRGDGAYEHCRDAGVVLRDHDGAALGAIGAVSIITAEVEARRAIDASVQQLSAALRGTIGAVATAVESRDPYTAGHQRRVASLSAAIARELGLAEHTVEGVAMGAAVHDVGAIGVPADILAKPARLSAIEFRIVQQHCAAGGAIFAEVVFPWPIASIILQHHERLDGSGYPSGLAGDAICREARIVAVADVVEAMASHRPYRPALGVDAGLAEVVANGGRLYDAEVVAACVRLFHEKGYRLDGV